MFTETISYLSIISSMHRDALIEAHETLLNIVEFYRDRALSSSPSGYKKEPKTLRVKSVVRATKPPFSYDED